METAIVILSALSAVLLIVTVILLIKGKKGGSDGQTEISQELLSSIRSEIAREGAFTRESVQGNLNSNREVTESAVRSENERAERLQKGVVEGLLTIRDEMKTAVKEMSESNEKNLEKIRLTVDEKLAENLEQRFQKSFAIVSERLDAITKGFGEMHNLTSGMSDLKRVLSNIKTRGSWGEASLDYLLSQMLSPEQYGKNVKVSRSETNDRVDFVINLPGKTNDKVWLPVDAKFPIEDYQRIVDAADDISLADAKRALSVRLRTEAVSIKNKYIKVPKTTDFAIMYLPVEGLFAEAMQIRGLSDELQNKHRVIMCGPTTLAALLNSLQMGFRSVAIEKRSSEIYKLLNAFKGDFATFCAIIEKTQQKLGEATKEITRASDRTRIIQKKLDKVQIEEVQTPELIGGTGENDEA